MSTVALGSAKGSPGVTTTTLALASWWHNPCIVIEADAAGGDIAARCGLPEEPGLVGMAAGLRRSPELRRTSDDWIADYVQEISTGIRVVAAPTGSHQSGVALELLSSTDPSRSLVGTDLLIDIGRHTDLQAPDSWVRGNSSDLFVWICRPVLADLAHLAAHLDRRKLDGRNQVVVICGTGPYPSAEIASTLDVAVIGHLPIDVEGAAALWAGGGRKWVRSALGRASRNLLDTVRTAIGSDAEVTRTESTSNVRNSPSVDQMIPDAESSVHD
jgi:hypothetical protein